MKLFKLIAANILSIPFIVVFIGALLFLPAGDFYWINGWMVISALVAYFIFNAVYFLIKDPSTLEKRSKLSTEKGDTIIIALIGISILIILILPAFDYRFKWSQIPFWISCIGLAGFVISLLIIFLVNKENSFASKGLRIHEGQKVITTGLYAIVRHPLYMGGIIMGISIPLALGSFISLLPAIFFPFIYVLRIPKEEQMLIRELEGYEDYQKKVKYRLIPFVW